jgi:hypothetical protein
LIHIHPHASIEEGKNANLERFFRSMGVTFNEDLLRLPDGQEFRDGDTCPDGQAGTLRLLVGKTTNLGIPGGCTDYALNDKFEKYVAQQNECVLVEFGPESASVLNQTSPPPQATPLPTFSPSPPASPSPAPGG